MSVIEEIKKDEDSKSFFISQKSKSINMQENKITNENFKYSFKEILSVYNYKLKLIKDNYDFTELVKRIWNMLDKDQYMKITKLVFVNLFTKIYLFLLPIYNRKEIPNHVQNEFIYISNGSESISFNQLKESLFKLTHTWCTHVNKIEYTYFLKTIIERISKKVRYLLDGSVISDNPYLIKVKLIKSIKNEYNKLTYEESYNNPETEHFYEIENIYNDNQYYQRLNGINYITINDEEDEFLIFNEQAIEVNSDMESKTYSIY